MNNKKLKILLIFSVVIIVLLILFVPKVIGLNDGGTKIYQALTYEVTKVHKIKTDSLNEFDEGTIVKIFGKEIYNDIPKEVDVIVDGTENEETSQEYEKEIENVKIALNIPKDWKYEELDKNIENDFYKYALKIYKTQEDKYAVIYYYHQPFGVCGTGRTSKKIILNNGNEAVIGYYDGSNVWQDISFYETNKYIAILNYGLDKAESEEVIDVVKTINVIENNKKNEDISLVVKEDTITSKEATFILKNDSNKTYTYGADYEIEIKNNNEWCKIELDTPLTWNEMLFMLKANTTNELNINFTIGYGELSSGKKYRLVKKVREEYKTDDIYLYAEFEIK